MSEKVAATKVVRKAEQGGTLVKLIMFSLSLAFVPISTFFGSQKYLWNGNATYAAITAVFAANAVLVAYIIVSILDDKRESTDVPKSGREGENEPKKER